MKKIKGFTLIELIIVMAIFSGIAVGAMAMIKPAMKLFNNTAEFEKANADADNVKRYIEDNLRYADRLINCIGYKDFDDIEKDTYAYYIYNDVTGETIETKTNQPVLTYIKDYYFPYSAPCNVYVMEIDNGAIDVQGTMGTVKIYNADLSSGNITLESEANSSYYSKYSFNINFGVDDGSGVYSGLNLSSEMYIDMFKIRKSADDAGNFFDDIMRDSAASHDITSAMNLMNIVSFIDIPIGENDDGIVEKKERSRYDSIKNPTLVDNPKYYFVYTVPEIIQP